MKQVVLELTPLDLVFLGIALVSLVGNVVQWRDRRNLYQPISSALIGLFNDIKSKANHAIWVQNTLFNPNNPHESFETLRWEFGDYTQTVWNYLQGFQEIVVAVLVSLNPDDKDGKASFRASDYGLTSEEKAIRRTRLEDLSREQERNGTPAAGSNDEHPRHEAAEVQPAPGGSPKGLPARKEPG